VEEFIPEWHAARGRVKKDFLTSDKDHYKNCIGPIRPIFDGRPAERGRSCTVFVEPSSVVLSVSIKNTVYEVFDYPVYPIYFV
jgi:hypothetical protein